jgi:hypothetical protein
MYAPVITAVTVTIPINVTLKCIPKISNAGGSIGCSALAIVKNPIAE